MGSPLGMGGDPPTGNRKGPLLQETLYTRSSERRKPQRAPSRSKEGCLTARKCPFKWRHFQSEIILLCVRWYLRYPLSYRHLEEMIRFERTKSGSHHGVSMGPGLCARTGSAMPSSPETHE